MHTTSSEFVVMALAVIMEEGLKQLDIDMEQAWEHIEPLLPDWGAIRNGSRGHA